jgi:serine/threonine-protein kinase
MAATKQQIIGRYVIYDSFAAGGMASVHFGRVHGSMGFSRTVAVKRLHGHLTGESDFVAAMIDEARLAARVQHPNVVPILDVVLDGDGLAIVMEYVRGESLARLLPIERSQRRFLAPQIACAIAVGALHGLQAAHEATSDHGDPLGIIHRDVSPQNILVSTDGLARVIDFGIAKASGRMQTTSTGVVKGKIAYMAPEQLRADAVMTPRVDVYALGVVLWEMLACRRLFDGDSDGPQLARVLAGVDEAPSKHVPGGLPVGLDAVVMRSLARDPADRFGSAREMADALVRIVPPALPPEVGAWVADTARETIGKRTAKVSEIETSSRVHEIDTSQMYAQLPFCGGAPQLASSRAGTAEGRELTDSSLFTGHLVEAHVVGPSARRRTHLDVAVGATLLLGAILLAVLSWHGNATSASKPSASIGSVMPTAAKAPSEAISALEQELPPASAPQASGSPAPPVSTAKPAKVGPRRPPPIRPPPAASGKPGNGIPSDWN